MKGADATSDGPGFVCLFVLFCLYLTSLTCKMEVITALTVKIKWVNMCEVLNCARYHRLLLRMFALLSVFVCLFLLSS